VAGIVGSPLGIVLDADEETDEEDTADGGDHAEEGAGE
jgi:hypothetical protein